MSNQTPQTNRTERIGEFVGRYLKEDIIDIGNLPLRDTGINFAMSILKVVVTAVNLVFSTCQLGFSIILAAGDLLARGLARVLPAPKVAAKETGKDSL